MLGHEHPGRPGDDEEKAGDAETPRWAPGKNDGLEGVERDSQAEKQSGDKCSDAQWRSSIEVSVLW